MAASRLGRRELIVTSAAAASLPMLVATASGSDGFAESPVAVIDTNVSLFRWPFRRLPLDRTDRLVRKLRSLGVTSAWASSFEGILHRDIQAVNERLAAECEAHPMLVAMGCINLALPNWLQDLRRCVDDHDMQGVRVFPGYHGYALSDSRFKKLLSEAAAADRFVQIVASMEDVRTQHPALRVADVELLPLRDVMRETPAARVQILNGRPRAATLEHLQQATVYFDTARVDQTDGVPRLSRSLPAGRVLYGSHAPFLIPEASLIRVHESGQLDGGQLANVFANNARRFLEKGDR